MLASLRCVLAVVPLALFACSSEQVVELNEGGSAQGAAAAAPADRALAEIATYDVKCGCSIDGVGHCGNFVMIEGQYIPILHPRLGKMEWCRNKAAGAKIKANGELKDGKFLAKDWKTIQ